ncbi:hypothetical protein JAB6_55960 [Janthinobacterium sp. HH104]|nr:hypothetical protein JAB6_55960 [Janthinobacterium sp. HH104]
MKIEYLVIIESDSTFCRDRASFNNFLQSNSDIKIHNNTFKYKNLEIGYELKLGQQEDGRNRFFNIKLECNNEKNIDEFHDLLKSIRSLLHRISDKKPQVLWDDISFHYAQKAYPMIHQIENLMRKLITKFMLTNVGLGWTKDTIPEDLRRSNKSEGIENNNNYLYETDFKDLSTFLFDEYRTIDIKSLNEKIRSADSEKMLASELRNFLPKSNWERYFREYVNCEGNYLQTRWEKLYKYRCKIAHNNSFTREDFKQTTILIDEISPKITDAISNLDKVEVPEADRDELAEIAAIRTSALYGDYIQRWKEVEKNIFELYKSANPEIDEETIRKRRYQPLILLRELLEHGYIGKRTHKEICEASQVRNIIVHEPGHHFSAEEMSQRVVRLGEITDQLSNSHIEVLLGSNKGNDAPETVHQAQLDGV